MNKTILRILPILPLLLLLTACSKEKDSVVYVESFSESVIDNSLENDLSITAMDSFVDDEVVRVFYGGNSYEYENNGPFWGYCNYKDGNGQIYKLPEGTEETEYVNDVVALSQAEVLLLLTQGDGSNAVEIRDIDNKLIKRCILNDGHKDNIEKIYVLDNRFLSENYAETYIYDEEFNLIFKQEHGDDHIDYLSGKNGTIYEIVWSDDGQSMVVEAELTDTQIVRKDTGPYNLSDLSVCVNHSGGDFAVYDRDGIYSCKYDVPGKSEIMNFMDSYIPDSYEYGFFQVINDDLIICLKNEITGFGDSYKNEIVAFEKREGAIQKKVLIMGCLRADNELRTRVAEFNRNNKEIKIEIKDYSEYQTNDNIFGDWDRLNVDLSQNDSLDILYITPETDVENYIRKGAFADLSEFLSKDEEINEEDLFECVLSAGSYKNALYMIIPQFSVETVLAKESEVNGLTGWTIDEFMDFKEAYPDREIFYSESREHLFSKILAMNMDDFIDYENKKCSFDCEEFMQLLLFSKQLKEGDYTVDYFGELAELFRNNKICLTDISLSSVGTYEYYLRVALGEKATLIGYPSPDREGMACQYPGAYAILKKCRNKDMAWDFIREVLLPEYQDEYVYEFPSSRTAFDRAAKKETEKEQATYYLGYSKISVDPVTYEEIEELKCYIDSIEKTMRYDNEIMSIIMEEAEYYYNGAKTADEVADIIQSRVSTMIKERY